MTLLGYIVVLIALLGLSAFFSASEMAYSSANRLRLESAAETGSRRARLACAICEQYDGALSAILIAGNLATFAATSICAVIAIIWLHNYKTLTTIALTAVIIVFAEALPKIMAKKNATRFAINAAFAVRALMLLLRPLVYVTVALTRLITGPERIEERAGEEEAVEELFTLLEAVEDEGVIDIERGELLHAALDFSETSASEVMTSRVDMVAIDIDDDWDELLATVENSEYSRIPVYEDTADNIIGILYVNHFYKALIDTDKPDIRSLLFKPCYVYKTLKLPEVLGELRRRRMHLAVVTDEYGGSMGVITMEDVLEELVGDIWDETDDVIPDITERGKGVFEISGDLSLRELFDRLELSAEETDAESSTVGGWTLERFGAFPEEGESFTANGLTVTVLEMDGLRVGKVLLTINN